jgi:hypothetical protein
MKTSSSLMRWVGGIPVMALVALALVGCPQLREPALPEEPVVKVTVALAAEEEPYVEDESALKSDGEENGDDCRRIDLESVESLTVKIFDVWFDRVTDHGIEPVKVFDGDVDVNLIDLAGLSEVLAATEIYAGHYVGITLELAQPRLVFKDDPGTEITSVWLPSEGLLSIPTNFWVDDAEDRLIILNLAKLKLMECPEGIFRLQTHFRVQLHEPFLASRAKGEITDINYDEDWFVLESHRTRLVVDYIDAGIFLPSDRFGASGTEEDLGPGARVMVYGELNYDGVLVADIIEVMRRAHHEPELEPELESDHKPERDGEHDGDDDLEDDDGDDLEDEDDDDEDRQDKAFLRLLEVLLVS